jgi:SAM-dependent methyltransferase
MDAARMRELLAAGRVAPASFRAAVAAIPARERDVWIDDVFGLDGLPDDGGELPRGCVNYLPCPVDRLLRILDVAGVQPGDVFVDVGAGIGRAAAFAHFATGADAIGIEIQSSLVQVSRELARRLNARVSVAHGDAARLTRASTGTVFFLYCPFSGPRLEAVLDDLEVIATTRPIRIAAVDLPIPARAWLVPIADGSTDGLGVYRSA